MRRPKGKRTASELTPSISREELQAKHAILKERRPRAGQEEFSLMCVIACCLDNWPRVRKEKAAEIRQRFRDLERGGRNYDPLPPQSSQPSRPEVIRQTEPSALTQEPRENFPPDWRAAYVMWSGKMTEKYKDDPAASRVVRDMIESLWECFEAEVEG